jgi:hypothetical protein
MRWSEPREVAMLDPDVVRCTKLRNETKLYHVENQIKKSCLCTALGCRQAQRAVSLGRIHACQK